MSAPRPPARDAWTIVGIVLATVIGICGLAVFAFIILAYASFSSYGSNK